MATLGNLYARIYDETHQTRTVAVANAVQSAYDFYQSQRFWCTENTRSFTISATAEVALRTALPGCIAIDAMVAGAQKYPLEKKPWRDILELDDGNVRGDPYCYAIHHEQLRFYPVPQSSITIEAIYVGMHTLTTSASSTSSSVWTNELEPLIRARAKAVLYADYYGDAEKAAMQYQVEGMYLKQFLDRTAQESTDGQLERYL